MHQPGQGQYGCVCDRGKRCRWFDFCCRHRCGAGFDRRHLGELVHSFGDPGAVQGSGHLYKRHDAPTSSVVALDPSVTAGGTVQLTATGTFTSGTQDVLLGRQHTGCYGFRYLGISKCRRGDSLCRARYGARSGSTSISIRKGDISIPISAGRVHWRFAPSLHRPMSDNIRALF